MGGANEMTTTGLILRLALVACSMFAMVHLISMWGTRYGDNNTLAKSFFLSLVLHGCFGLGWATVSDSFPSRPQGPETVVVQTPIDFVDDVDSAPSKGTSKLPIFHSGTANSELPLTRESRNANRIEANRVMEEIDSPQINHAPLAAMPRDVPNFESQTEEQTPSVDRASVPMSKSAASAPLTADQGTQEARPEASTKTGASRSSINSLPSTAIEAPSRPVATRGTSQQLAPALDEGAVLTFPTETAGDAPPKPQGAPNDEIIRRPGSPDPVVIVDSNVGAGPEPGNSPSTNSNPRRASRASRGSAGGTDGSDDAPLQPQNRRKKSSDNNRLTDTRAADDRMLSGNASTDSTDESPRPRLDRPKSGSLSRTPARAPETYQARSSDQRMSSVLKNGGSEESELAVENSLKWLSSIQERDGHWSASRYGGGSVSVDPHGQTRFDDGKFADTGVTGLVVLSFLGAGYSHEKGPYTGEIRDALDWLIDQQDRKDGYLRGSAKSYDQNYCHAIATFALAEAYAMQKEANDYPELRNAVKLGVRKISELQNNDGGWRYAKNSESDMSMFGWQLMALKSAVNAGISVREDTRLGMVKFLNSNSLGDHGGLAGYKKGNLPTPAMTAEAMFCRQMFAVRANDAARREGIAYLLRHLPRVTDYDEYYWYYGTLAMRGADDDSWQQWNDSLRDMLISQQRKQGTMAGSWDPKGKWAGIGGRLYSTALSTMCLEVYYRYQSTPKQNDDQ
jgi:hypothetical protein